MHRRRQLFWLGGGGGEAWHCPPPPTYIYAILNDVSAYRVSYLSHFIINYTFKSHLQELLGIIHHGVVLNENGMKWAVFTWKIGELKGSPSPFLSLWFQCIYIIQNMCGKCWMWFYSTYLQKLWFPGLLWTVGPTFQFPILYKNVYQFAAPVLYQHLT